MTPIDGEMKEFSKSLEEHIGASFDVMLKYAGKGEFLLKGAKLSCWFK